MLGVVHIGRGVSAQHGHWSVAEGLITSPAATAELARSLPTNIEPPSDRVAGPFTPRE
jgi:hypothetical protein